MTDEYQTYDEIKQEAENPHVTADMLNILVQRTKELSSLKQHDVKKLQELLRDLEAKLSRVENQAD